MVQKKIDVGGKDAGNGVLINEVTACTECPVEWPCVEQRDVSLEKHDLLSILSISGSSSYNEQVPSIFSCQQRLPFPSKIYTTSKFHSKSSRTVGVEMTGRYRKVSIN